MSAFDPARLEDMASLIERGLVPMGSTAAALRAFAQVVRVLERADQMDVHDALTVGRADANTDPARCYAEVAVSDTRLGIGIEWRQGYGPSPFAAVLALAEALAKEGE
jgi:hypothetical protein